jgi:uncharacterized protein (TIGR01370 family)
VGGAGRAAHAAAASLGLVLAMAGAASCWRPAASTTAGADLANVRRWWIVIGHAAGLEGVDWRRAARDTQMVVLAADPRLRVAELPPQTIRLGYLSVGEVNVETPPWRDRAPRSFLIEPNQNWPANVRVDVRDRRWQDRLLAEEAPRLLGMGFQGFMLDTIDTAPYLEGKDPARFAGSRQALREWTRVLRRTFPTAVVIANGAEALVDVAPFVDAYVVEGVFATYDFARRLYRRTTEAERGWKLARIDSAQQVARRPVFTIEYADIGDVELGRWATQESERHGFHPYVAVKDINTIP